MYTLVQQLPCVYFYLNTVIIQIKESLLWNRKLDLARSRSPDWCTVQRTEMERHVRSEIAREIEYVGGSTWS